MHVDINQVLYRYTLYVILIILHTSPLITFEVDVYFLCSENVIFNEENNHMHKQISLQKTFSNI